MAEPILNVKQQVLAKTWNYLNDNFHKFSDGNKIKVALALGLKDMPTQVEGGLSFNKMPTVMIDGQPQEINIGDPSTTNSSGSREITYDTD